MCRWIAYRGDTIALEHYVTEPSHSLISQSIKALESTVSTNGDGFGLGWYGEYSDPGLYREVRPAWSDENLRYLCRHIRSHLFFAHIRAATGTSITRPNCHPFVCKNWLFMHNGFIGDWSRLRRPIENMIPDEIYPSRLGTTDSEAVFLAIMGAGAGSFAVIRIVETEGVNLPPAEWTPDAVAAHFKEIADMSTAKALEGAFEQTQKYVGHAAKREGIKL